MRTRRGHVVCFRPQQLPSRTHAEIPHPPARPAQRRPQAAGHLPAGPDGRDLHQRHPDQREVHRHRLRPQGDARASPTSNACGRRCSRWRGWRGAVRRADARAGGAPSADRGGAGHAERHAARPSAARCSASDGGLPAPPRHQASMHAARCDRAGRALVTRVGNQSNLILDPDLDSYYTMSLVLLRFPELLDLVAAIGRAPARAAARRAAERGRLRARATSSSKAGSTRSRRASQSDYTEAFAAAAGAAAQAPRRRRAARSRRHRALPRGWPRRARQPAGDAERPPRSTRLQQRALFDRLDARLARGQRASSTRLLARARATASSPACGCTWAPRCCCCCCILSAVFHVARPDLAAAARACRTWPTRCAAPATTRCARTGTAATRSAAWCSASTTCWRSSTASADPAGAGRERARRRGAARPGRARSRFR